MKPAPIPSFSPDFSSAELSQGIPESLPIEQLDLFIEQNPDLIEKIIKAETQTLGRAMALSRTTMNARSLIGARISNEACRPIRTEGDTDNSKRLVELIIPTVTAERPEDKYIDRRYNPPLLLPRVSFMFSTVEDAANRIQGKIHGFINPDDVSFEGVFMGYGNSPQRIPLREVVGLTNPEGHSRGTLVRRGESTQHLPPGEVVELSELGIIVRNDVYEALADLPAKPLAECGDAIDILVTLGQEQHLDPQLIETLSSLIRDYATYRKPEPITSEECGAEIGRCLVIPQDFRAFCKEWAGINIATGQYSEPGYFHKVNVFGDIIIDWTARQFSSDTPYPYIYRKGDSSAWSNELSAIQD